MTRDASKRWAVFLMLGVLLIGRSNKIFAKMQSQQKICEEILITEAAAEPYEAKVGVAEVLRNRGWNSKGFVGIKRNDKSQFVARQPDWVHSQTQRALKAAKEGSNLTQSATHFENVEAFGYPDWAKDMKKTVKIGKLTFFREKNQA